MPLAGYHVESTSTYTCRIEVAFGFSSGNLEESYTDIPQPDDDGVFNINGKDRIVLPVAQDEDLAAAEIRCVGEQLHDFIADRLGSTPPIFHGMLRSSSLGFRPVRGFTNSSRVNRLSDTFGVSTGLIGKPIFVASILNGSIAS